MEETTPSSQPSEPKNGNSTKIIAAVVVILVILAAVWFGMSKKNKPTVKSGSENAPKMQEDKSTAQPMSLKELMAGGKTQKCTFSASSDSASNQGSVYIADGKMRADFSSTVNGKAMGGHMINDGKFMYSWSDQEKTGAKMSVETMTNMQANTQVPSGQAQVKSGVDQNAKYSYDCSGWTASQDEFTPPTDVNFIDPSAMMNQIKTPTGAPAGTDSASVKAAQCAACDQAGASKAQCLAALHCN